MDINRVKEAFDSSILQVATQAELAELKTEYLGKTGKLNLLLKTIVSLPNSQKRTIGSQLNKIQEYISNKISICKQKLIRNSINESLLSEKIDVTLPSSSSVAGGIHPISHSIILLRNIFKSMGFLEVEAPEIDSEWNNFTGLNIASSHPARQMTDTFYIRGSKLLLRTHTSNAQVRYLRSLKPFNKVFSIGKVYRADNDSTHTPMFHQLEASCLNEDISIPDLKRCIIETLKHFFLNSNIPIRFRTSYFPFTEPSFEVDIQHHVKYQNSTSQTKWLEILGCGMIHDKVLENLDINHKTHQAFALGLGIERITMLKYGISDIRDFYNSSMSWLKHYSF